MSKEMAIDINLLMENEADLKKCNEFMEKLTKDADTMAKLETAANIEEFFAAAKKYVKCSFDEFKKSYDNFSTQIQQDINKLFPERELAEDELDVVVGGSWSFWAKVGIAALCAVAIASAVAVVVATGGAAAGFIAGGVGQALGVAGMAAGAGAAQGAVAGAVAGFSLGLYNGAKNIYQVASKYKD